MSNYRHRITCKAIQFTNIEENIRELKEWIGEECYVDNDDPEEPKLIIDDYTEAGLNEWVTKSDFYSDYIVYPDEQFNEYFELIN